MGLLRFASGRGAETSRVHTLCALRAYSPALVPYLEPGTKLDYASLPARNGRAASIAGLHTGAVSARTFSGFAVPVQTCTMVDTAHQGSLVARSTTTGVAAWAQ